MPPKKITSSPVQETAAKRPAQMRRKAAAQEAAEKALVGEYVSPLPNISPLELAHLVAAMGLSEHADGPLQALMLVSKCAGVIEKNKAFFALLNNQMAKAKADEVLAMITIGISPEQRDAKFTLDEVIAKMPTDRLKIGNSMLRSKELWDEYCRLTESPVSADSDSPDGLRLFSVTELMGIYSKFCTWREGIAKRNQAKGKKNLNKKKDGLSAGFEAEEVNSVGETDSVSPFVRRPKP
jgi:hypothetical protein